MEVLPLLACIIIQFYFDKNIPSWMWLISVAIAILSSAPLAKNYNIKG